ncbi:MAG: 3-phosphoshikimate 1-carboxyvinyltransferase [Gammaproteobacteria bacterium]|nr:3-phosphoshikimate 1-carboxyvinyltransferase [Gammaproteobacteria bacterium]
MSNLSLIANPCKTVSGKINIPGDKSISHRAIILSMLCTGKTYIHNLLEAEDVKNTIKISKLLGLTIIKHQEFIEINGLGLNGLSKPSGNLDFGNSGTSLRLFMGILSSQNFTSILTGDESLLNRPMERVAIPLKQMGARISMIDGKAPITIKPPKKRLQGINYQLDIPSAQIKSAIIFASLFCKNDSSISFNSITRDHTERMLQLFNYPIISKKNTIKIHAGKLETPRQIDIPGDFSSASFFIVATLIAKKSKVTICNVGLNDTRTGLLQILKLMGADITINITKHDSYEIVGDITIQSSNLHGIRVPKELISLAIDELPLIFIAAANAKGQTIIRNAEELRFKESDRIKSMVSLLKILNIDVTEYHDGLDIRGGSIEGGEINSFGDHRIAMSALIASCASKEKIIVSNCENINTSFPTFISLMNSIGLDIYNKEI